MLRLLRLYPFSIACIALIWILCLLRPSSLPEGPRIPYADKVVHCLMYLGLCSLLWWEHLKAAPTIRWKHFLLLGVIAPIVMSGLIELAQGYFTDNRSADWWDFVANAVGVVLAIPCGLLFIRPLTKRFFRHKS